MAVAQWLGIAPEIAGNHVQRLPTAGANSALNLLHSSIVFDLHQITEIRAELLGDSGVATEKIKHANSFTCLKFFAYGQRFERNDAHDLIYCIEHASKGWMRWRRHFGTSVAASMGLSSRRWQSCVTASRMTRRPRVGGPVAVAKFELGEGDEPDRGAARALRQCQASDVVVQLLAPHWLMGTWHEFPCGH